MTKPSANLRLFVAVYPPREMAEAWVKRIASLDLPAYRLMPVEQVHLTLQFIGDTPVKALDETIESCRRAAKGLDAFALTVRRFITLPERGRSRLIAVETSAHPTLLELKRRLATRLASNVRENPAKKFLPHLTVCRFRSPSKVIGFDAVLPGETFDVRELMVMKSALKPSGAVHEALERIPLV